MGLSVLNCATDISIKDFKMFLFIRFLSCHAHWKACIIKKVWRKAQNRAVSAAIY